MTEKLIEKVEKTDIEAPKLEAGGTAIVLQRHSKYERKRDIETAGSILEEDARATKEQDVRFFEDMFAQDKADGVETMVLFVSSDTAYAGKGRRSMETGQLAQDAALETLMSMGLSREEAENRIINFNTGFSVKRHEPTDQDVRSMPGLVEPKIFDESPEFVAYLKEKYADNSIAEQSAGGMSPEAFAAYEMDADAEVREEMGAEGVYDILDRTKHSVEMLARYAKWFHAKNPGKRLVIWGTSHYDTISPLVKDTTEVGFDEYVGVDYGGGIVMEVPVETKDVILAARGKRVAVKLGKSSLENAA